MDIVGTKGCTVAVVNEHGVPRVKVRVGGGVGPQDPTVILGG